MRVCMARGEPCDLGGAAVIQRIDTHTAVDGFPIDVGKERVDVVSALRRGIVQEKGMLPHIHYEDGDAPYDVPMLVERGPMVGETAV